jgi:hypothetical protein
MDFNAIALVVVARFTEQTEDPTTNLEGSLKNGNGSVL